MFEGKVLDGRHRARALHELNVRPVVRPYEGDAPARFVLSLNVKRRSLSASQRAALAVEFLPVLEEEARGRQGSRADLTSGSIDPEVPKPARSREAAGALVGVSGATVGRAKQLKRERPDEFEQVKAGRKTINAALTGNAERKTPTFSNDTERGRQVHAKAAERVWKLVSGIDGYRMGLEGFDVDRALAGASDEDIKQWDRILTDSIKSFRELRSQIRKER